MWTSCKVAAWQHFWKLKYDNEGGLVTMRGLRSHQNLAAPEHLQFWAPLTASICITCGYRGWFSFSQWGKCPSLKGQQRGFQLFSFPMCSYIIPVFAAVTPPCLLWKRIIYCENIFFLFFFFSEQPNEILHSLEARRSHGNSTFPLWFPFFSIFISSFTLPLSVTLYLLQPLPYPLFFSSPYSSFQLFPMIFYYQTCWNVCCLDAFPACK